MSDVLRIKTGDHVFLVGTTGSGKTHLARIMLAPLTYLVILDPKHQFSWDQTKLPYGRGIMTQNPREVVQYTEKEPIIYRPDSGQLAAGIGWFWEWIWRRENTYLYIDEILPVCPKPMSPPFGLLKLYQMGRSRNISVIAATQRPSRVPLVCITEATHDFIFRLRNIEDRKRMAAYTDNKTLLDPPTGHEFWYYGDREQILIKTDADRLLMKTTRQRKRK